MLFVATCHNKSSSLLWTAFLSECNKSDYPQNGEWDSNSDVTLQIKHSENLHLKLCTRIVWQSNVGLIVVSH